MDILIQNLLPYILAYKYFALFIISLSAAFIIPIPSGSLLMATSAFASMSGYFNFTLVILISIIGNILGDNLSYWWARMYGKKIFSYIGFRKIIKSKTFNLMEEKFRKNPGIIVFLSRFEVLSTLSINIISGISRVPYKKYLLYESIGSVSQVLFYGFIGYIFGYNWESADTFIGKISILILTILILLFFLYKNKIMFYIRRK